MVRNLDRKGDLYEQKRDFRLAICSLERMIVFLKVLATLDVIDGGAESRKRVKPHSDVWILKCFEIYWKFWGNEDPLCDTHADNKLESWGISFFSGRVSAHMQFCLCLLHSFCAPIWNIDLWHWACTLGFNKMHVLCTPVSHSTLVGRP